MESNHIIDYLIQLEPMLYEFDYCFDEQTEELNCFSLIKSNCFRKLLDIIMVRYFKEYLESDNQNLYNTYDSYKYILDDHTTYTGIFNKVAEDYHWNLHPDYKFQYYMDDDNDLNIFYSLPQEFKTFILGLGDFLLEHEDGDNDDYGDTDDPLYKLGISFSFRVISNRKLSLIHDAISKDILSTEDIAMFSELTNKFIDMLVSPPAMHDIIKIGNNYYFSFIYFGLYDENYINYSYVDMDNYFKPSLLFEFPKLDHELDLLLNKYKIAGS